MASESNEQDLKPSTRCGYVAIVGRPNTGKSTLLNHLLEQKLSITSRKPQTTRYNLLGIVTEEDTQIVLIDTPGLHSNVSGPGKSKAINALMNRSASSAMQGVSLVMMMVDRDVWTEQDEAILRQVVQTKVPFFLVINKIDQLDDQNALLPILSALQDRAPEAELVPVSALQGKNIERLKSLIRSKLPHSEFIFSEDELTDKSVRFLCAEIIREKIIRQCGNELPYESAVEIEEFDESGPLIHIQALILVEREGQKRIVIGDKGARLKAISSSARHDIEKLLECRVFLRCWVKVRSGWSDSERALKSLGIGQAFD